MEIRRFLLWALWFIIGCSPALADEPTPIPSPSTTPAPACVGPRVLHSVYGLAVPAPAEYGDTVLCIDVADWNCAPALGLHPISVVIQRIDTDDAGGTVQHMNHAMEGGIVRDAGGAITAMCIRSAEGLDEGEEARAALASLFIVEAP